MDELERLLLKLGSRLGTKYSKTEYVSDPLNYRIGFNDAVEYYTKLILDLVNDYDIEKYIPIINKKLNNIINKEVS